MRMLLSARSSTRLDAQPSRTTLRPLRTSASLRPVLNLLAAPTNASGPLATHWAQLPARHMSCPPIASIRSSARAYG